MQDFLVGSSLATAIGAAVFYGTRVSAGTCSLKLACDLLANCLSQLHPVMIAV
jgi:hypothetical protein